MSFRHYSLTFANHFWHNNKAIIEPRSLWTTSTLVTTSFTGSLFFPSAGDWKKRDPGSEVALVRLANEIFEENLVWNDTNIYAFRIFFPTRPKRHILGTVSRKSRRLFGPEKPFVKLRPVYSVKLGFSYVAKGIKVKIRAKFRALRHLGFEDTETTMSPEMRPKSDGTFEKCVPCLSCTKGLIAPSPPIPSCFQALNNWSLRGM